MAISQRTVDKILTNQSNSARKVYDILRDDPWTVNRIVQELRNANAGNTPDRKVVSGCLNDLTDAKILKRTGQDLYSRAPVRKDSFKPLKVSEFPPLIPTVLPREIAKGIVIVPKDTSTTNTLVKPPVASPLSAVQAVGRSNRAEPGKTPVKDKAPIHVSKAQAAFDHAHEAAVLAHTPTPANTPPVSVLVADASHNPYADGRAMQETHGEITDPLLKAYALADEVADMADAMARMSMAIRESAIELEKEREKVRVKSEKLEKITEALRSLQLGD